MTAVLRVRPLSELAASLKHVPCPQNERFADGRRDGLYNYADVGTDAIRATWEGFDTAYRKAPRYLGNWIAELEGAVVHPPYQIVTIGNDVVAETVRTSGMLASTFPFLDAPTARKVIKGMAYPIEQPLHQSETLRPDGVLLGWGLAANYFNWTLRYLSNVASLQALGAGAILAPPPLANFQWRSLEFFGVSPDEITHIIGPTKVGRLRLLSPMAIGRYDLSPRMVEALRNHPSVEGVWRREPRALYVERGDVKMRRVVNEDAVLSQAKALGLEIFDPGSQSMIEQVRAFRDADLIVAAHGAALTNIVYCRPGTRVIEIVPEGYDQGVTSYRSLSDMFGLEYEQLFSREAVPDRKGNRCNSDIEISLDGLKRALGS
ncbi:MAG: glycosyltransferase family 61 protein [Alphaproteobacteria bacterium]|nr:MAG: glycosyltransferase family 61 protein [Alphaproteobacteria bacterium]